MSNSAPYVDGTSKLFRDVAVGETFDFISFGHRSSAAPDSFYKRCRKVSARCYTWFGYDGVPMRSQIGTVDCRVYHVQPA